MEQAALSALEPQASLGEEKRLFMKLPKESDKEHVINNKEEKRGVQVKEEVVDKELFDQLRELRKEIAAKEGVPAYIVFSDASLRDMCRKKPASLIQFSAVIGVGSVKLEKYGEIFLKIISNE